MDVDCSLESDNDGINEVVEALLNIGQGNNNVPPPESDVVSSVDNGPVTSPDCDLNSNFQPHAKTKGSLRQQLRRKRQQVISRNVASPSATQATDKTTHSSDKKATLPSHAASQVF